MKKPKDELDYPPEIFPPEAPISALEEMERQRQLYLRVDLFERLKEEGKWDKVRKVANWVLWDYGVDLSND